MSDRKAKPWDLFNKKIGRVDNGVFVERFEICKSCPEFIKLTTQCKQCGCIMSAKTKLPNAECPLGKWGRIDEDEKN